MRARTIAGGLLLVAAGSLNAQVRPGPAGARRDSMMNRAQMEQQVRERLGGMMKQRLGLSDQQMPKLQETNRRFQERHRLLVEQERDIRMSLRDEMIAGDSAARQTQVSGLLDRMLKVQRQRLDLLEQEQKELSGFLTPVQRAKYLGVQEGMRRRLEQMRQQRGGGGMGPMQNRMGPGGPNEGMRPMGPMGQGRGAQTMRPRRPIGPGGPPPDSLFF